MPSVQKVSIISNNLNDTEVDWEVILKGSLLKWREFEQRFPDNFIMKFNQLSGDLDKFDGYWKLEKITENDTNANLYIDFEIGIPMLKDMLDPVATKSLTENANEMLNSLNEKVQQV
ncbi:polyketide cyclase/dehydrase [Leptospira interrogans serovar Grippotyphosa str. UI 12764]|nr:polyketide cyclase/dehydrase [Leptospira interrogans serovar Grippotyphosa str. UI 12764]